MHDVEVVGVSQERFNYPVRIRDNDQSMCLISKLVDVNYIIDYGKWSIRMWYWDLCDVVRRITKFSFELEVYI